jgi:hypothetical protein
LGLDPAHRTVEVPMNRLDSIYAGDAGFIKIDVEGHQQAVLDGAVATIQRCRPRMLVEVEERLSPGGLARAKAYFEELGYCGYYVHHGRLNPIDQFSAAGAAKAVRLARLDGDTGRTRAVRTLHLQFHLPAARRAGGDTASAVRPPVPALTRRSVVPRKCATRWRPMRSQSKRSAQAA